MTGLELSLVALFATVCSVLAYMTGAQSKRRPIIIQKVDPFDERGQLPESVAYAGAIQVIAFATTGEYSDTKVPYLRAMTALKRFGEAHPEVESSYGPPPFLEV